MRYVQHKNDAQGPRYRLVENHWNRELSLGCMLANSWEVYNEDSFRSNLFLPRAEYIICNAPEVWKDVTEQFTVQVNGFVASTMGTVSIELFGHNFYGYRLRKITYPYGVKDLPAFIVEQKQ